MASAARNLISILLEKKSAIITKWFNLSLEIYPPETVRNLKNINQQFNNPVGHTFYHAMEGIFEQLLQETASEKVALYLDKILRIKAVQDINPSQVVSFVFQLKRIVREELGDVTFSNRALMQEFLDFELKIDDLSMVAFGIYTDCREKICQLRLAEVKKKNEILERISLLNGHHYQTFDEQEGVGDDLK
ncbi:MAG: RsbRD N-terminal domain-containing protein [Bacillota bacterium]